MSKDKLRRGMLGTDKIAVDIEIAIAACEDEMKHARALGAGWFEVYRSSYRVLDEVLDIARAPMPADVLTRFKSRDWR